MANKPKSEGGRPTKYKKEYAAIAKKMCELGATDFDIVEALGVARSTFYKWKHDYPEFSDSLSVGKVKADDRVEMSLYRKAVGYEFDAVKIFQFQGEPIVVPYTEIVHPDTTAAIFWLKNRKPDEWREKTEVDNTVTHNIMPVPTADSAESWEEAAKKQQSEALSKDG